MAGMNLVVVGSLGEMGIEESKDNKGIDRYESSLSCNLFGQDLYVFVHCL
jgi:hypothetical protein